MSKELLLIIRYIAGEIKISKFEEFYVNQNTHGKRMCIYLRMIVKNVNDLKKVVYSSSLKFRTGYD